MQSCRAPLWSLQKNTPLQKPKYKLDENLNYIEEICKEPLDYYDKCSSKPCTKCSSDTRCTDPPKPKIDTTKCGYRRHYVPEPSPHSFEGDPLYGWSTAGAKGPNDEGPFSVVTMQPYGYPQAAAIVLLNDAEPSRSLPAPIPTPFSGLQKLNKYPNKRGVLLPDCPFRENQAECSTIGCPSYVTPGTFNPETGRYTPKRYFPPHFHKMHGFLRNKALAEWEDPGFTIDSCFTYPDDMDYETKLREVFGFCQEGPCGQISQRQEVGKCQYIDCPAKVCVEPEPEAEHDSEEMFKLPGSAESDVRPGQVVIEHGISRQTCCFDSISSFGESDMSESAISEMSEGAAKEKRRISWHGEYPGEDFEPDKIEYFRSMLSTIDFDRNFKLCSQKAQSRAMPKYVPHRRCTWRDGRDTRPKLDEEARESAKHILKDLFDHELSTRTDELQELYADPYESRNVSKGIIDGILHVSESVGMKNEFESHEPGHTFKKSRESRRSRKSKKGRPTSRDTRSERSRSTKKSGSSRDSSRTSSKNRLQNKSTQGKESRKGIGSDSDRSVKKPSSSGNRKSKSNKSKDDVKEVLNLF